MASTIDETKPTTEVATTASVRANFAAAKSEIEALQISVAAAEMSIAGLVIGTDVQAYSSRLTDIAAIDPIDDRFLVGDGTTWVPESAATVRASMGVRIGTDVQAYNANLAAIGALAPSAGDVLQYSGGWTAAAGRVRLTANRDYYIATTGSDSNDGLTVGTPWLTFAKAVDVIWNDLDLDGKTVTVNVADGAYTERLIIEGDAVGQKTDQDIYFKGNTADYTAVTITNALATVNVFNGARVRIEGFQVSATGAGGTGMKVYGGARCYVGNIGFDTCDTGMMQAADGIIGWIGDCHVIGDAPYFVVSEVGNGHVDFSSQTVYIHGARTFSSFFLNCGENSTISLHSMTWDTATHAGSVTGKAYEITDSGVILPSSARASIPGSVAGTDIEYGTAADFATVAATTSVTTPLVTNAGTLALSATGANEITFSTNGTVRGRVLSGGEIIFGTTTATLGSALVHSRAASGLICSLYNSGATGGVLRLYHENAAVNCLALYSAGVERGSVSTDLAGLVLVSSADMTLNATTNIVAGSKFRRTTTTGITAGTTQTQAGATALTSDINRVTVVGTNGDGVALPTAAAGLEVMVINDDSTQTLQVWPASGDGIDGGSADAADAVQIAAGEARLYAAYDATNWRTIYTA